MQVAVSAPSPDDKPIDWQMIQSLYLQGLGPTEIAKRTGVKSDTISVRATRHGWSKALRKATAERQSVSVTVQTSEAKSQGESKLAKHSEAVRAGLADVLKRSVETIQAMTLSNPKAALKANQELESVVRNAKTVFGWSEGQSTPAVRIAIMGNTTVQVEEPVQEKPVIDVPPPDC